MQVLTLDEAAARARIVRRSLERLLSEGEGPATVALSKRRRGILESDFEAWLLSRRKAQPGEATAA
jgi:predicted DNA-binding transcriptional regulator AlpA